MSWECCSRTGTGGCGVWGVPRQRPMSLCACRAPSWETNELQLETPPSPDGIPGALPSQAVPAAPGDTGHPNPLCRQHVLCFACGIFPPLSSFFIISLLFQERYSSGAGRGIRCSRVCLRCSPCSSRRCSPARSRCLSEPSRCRPGITHGVRLEEGGGRPRSLLCLQLFVSHPLIDIFFPPPLFLLLPTFSVPAP